MTRYRHRPGALPALLLLVALALAPFVLAGCGSSGGSDGPSSSPTTSSSVPGSPDDIIGKLEAAGNYTRLLAAVRAAGLEEVLRGTGPFTLFAPDDAAFAKLDPKELDALMAEPFGALADVLTYHLVMGKVTTADLKDGEKLETANGNSKLTIKVAGDGTVTVNDARVISPDVAASNGEIQGIDTVLMPPGL
jgi:uncharacterized surface protein with fasciclin (FAS1) repeats